MILLINLIIVLAILMVVITLMVLASPTGYENKEGFHYGKPSLNKKKESKKKSTSDRACR